MQYLLDTNICIYIIKNAPPQVFEKLSSLKIGDVGISSITYSELQFGVARSANKEKNQQALNEFLAPVEILDYPSGASILYGDVCAELKKKGVSISPLGLLVGVHGLFLGVPLVTNNEKEFERIPNLKVENWI